MRSVECVLWVGEHRLGVRSQNIYLKKCPLIRNLQDNKRLLIISGRGNRVCKDIEAGGSRTHSREKK